MIATDVQLVWGAASDRGLRRARNEDSFLAERPLFLVADGMGGHAEGARASRAAVAGFENLVGRASASFDEVERAFDAVAEDVRSMADAEGAAPGTTLAGVALCEQDGETYWLVLNIGDSRTYRFADGALRQISVDHSAVQNLIDRGEIAAAEAAAHPPRNVVTRAVGGGAIAPADYWLLPVAERERILVCSDGLTRELDHDAIARVLVEEPSADAAAHRLVNEALLRGGRDNITVVVVDASAAATVDDDPTAPGSDGGSSSSPDEIAVETVPRLGANETGSRT